jgi:ParB-like chromosome segregation protein Spo0J
MTIPPVRTMPVGQLVPAPYNPRRIGAKEFGRLKASVAKFGLVQPLVWNERTGHVVGGHQRLRAAVELGYEEVPVSVVRLADAEEKALNVVLNNREAQGRYDSEGLAELLLELDGLPELEDTGFGLGVLEDLRMEPGEVFAEDTENDGVEVKLRLTREQWKTIKPKLDGLVREYNFRVWVRGAV